MVKFIHEFPALYAATILLSVLIVVFISEKGFYFVRSMKRQKERKRAKQLLKSAEKAGIKNPGSMDKATLINMVSRYNKECRRKKRLLPNEPRSGANQVSSWERRMKK